MATVIHHIKDKKSLFAIYQVERTKEFIRDEINKIIATKRTITPGAIIHAHLISSDEAALFIIKYPLPLGYELSPEFKKKIDEIRAEKTKTPF